MMLDGSEPRRDCQDQNIFRSGAKRKIMNGLNAWNQVEGIFRPKKFQFVFRSAQSCKVLPCCS